MGSPSLRSRDGEKGDEYIQLGKLSTKNKNCGAMWSKVDIFSLLLPFN
jgi:hypothetical protein